jgi:hypothetical protein
VNRSRNLREYRAAFEKKLALEQKTWIFSRMFTPIKRTGFVCAQLCAASQRWTAQQWYKLRALDDVQKLLLLSIS